MNYTKFTFFLLLVTALIKLQAQQNINASGGNTYGNEGSMSYTVGQVFYQTQVGLNGSLTEGHLQPYEISEVKGVDEKSDLNITILVYPNPTKDYITLKIEEFENFELSYQLYDLNGNVLNKGNILLNHTPIVMSNLPSTTYFINVFQSDKVIKSFKIIKN